MASLRNIFPPLQHNRPTAAGRESATASYHENPNSCHIDDNSAGMPRWKSIGKIVNRPQIEKKLLEELLRTLREGTLAKGLQHWPIQNSDNDDLHRKLKKTNSNSQKNIARLILRTNYVGSFPNAPDNSVSAKRVKVLIPYCLTMSKPHWKKELEKWAFQRCNTERHLSN
jgi:hypothetical protein